MRVRPGPQRLSAEHWNRLRNWMHRHNATLHKLSDSTIADILNRRTKSLPADLAAEATQAPHLPRIQVETVTEMRRLLAWTAAATER